MIGFARWGEIVVRRRWPVLGLVAAALLALGGYGLGLSSHLSSGGWDDPGSESVRAARLRDTAFGRDHSGDVILLFHAPDGTTIDDPDFARTVTAYLNDLPRRHPREITGVNGAYWPTETGVAQRAIFGTADRRDGFASIALAGDDDTTRMRNFHTVAADFRLPGVDLRVAGGQPVGAALNDTMAQDQRRMELLAVPAVAVLLFLLFGGAVAAALPLLCGGLTVLGAWGIVRSLTTVTEVNSFVEPIVSMIGLGLAVDYGLFLVSRFREQLAAGDEVDAAVGHAVSTAGRTVVFSAVIVVTASSGVLLFPQNFLRSFAFGAIVTVTLAALTSLTVLPALLAVLGRRVNRLGVKRFRGTGADPAGRWYRTVACVVKHPVAVLIPVCAGLLLLIAPITDLAFGGISERFLPPQHATRVAQQRFDELFPARRIDPVLLVIRTDDPRAAGAVWQQANGVDGLAAPFGVPRRSTTRPDVFTTDAPLRNSRAADPTIEQLRAIATPPGTTVEVGGQPAVLHDSLRALAERLPWMVALVVSATTVLLFLAFGSLVLPVQAAVLNALGLAATLGISTWIFIDGHGSGLIGFTPQPIMALVLVVIIAVVYGLSTDYEVFLLSRIAEARAAGAATAEAVRTGTASTGRIITAAAVILLVVVGAFACSELLMMQYIAYGTIAALLIDVTVLRILLVPATMALLGERCWWPRGGVEK
ncbi:MMPL family transporter [Nocardia sp. CDC160]|uniref:MMPL family transporter n=1 Tax=Nocardia sp. CDC160 TaxID=3112166 RepID=UPI002DBA1520|nr:MMPL family transporter [Nocardia sp. CDC160]MEC3919765.1 MMPL family transporter [Nocardia sp. CDC160]